MVYSRGLSAAAVPLHRAADALSSKHLGAVGSNVSTLHKNLLELAVVRALPLSDPSYLEGLVPRIEALLRKWDIKREERIERERWEKVQV